jgi:hypothetical protein
VIGGTGRAVPRPLATVNRQPQRAGGPAAARRHSSVEALLVLIGAPRLRSIGLDVPAADVPDPDHALYHLLARDDSDSAHSRYNALIRQLVSFERAAECDSRCSPRWPVAGGQ